jgi:citrate lyase subunit beta/citryl-CoA lyase
MSARSYLFVPGDRPEMLAKAGGRGADAIIADLEDAVAPSAKTEARKTVAAWLAELHDPPFEAWVRINPELVEADVTAVFGPGLTGVMVPKLRSREELDSVIELLDDLEATSDRPGVMLLPIIETARGLLAAPEFASAPRVHQLMIGEFDLAADLGIDASDETTFAPLRMQIVVASAASGIEAPLGPVSADYRDLKDLRETTRRLMRIGFGSRPAIHPAQVPVINEVFTPDPEEVERSRRLVSLYDAALAAGRGAITDDEGRMLDEAVVKVARRVLERADRADGPH